jgi:uncharacterized membrane protein
MARRTHLADPAPPVRQSIEHSPAVATPHPMEIWISYVLRGGVLIAAVIIAAGLALFFYQEAGHPQATALHTLAGAPASISFPSILRSAAHLRATGIIELGLLALILTPMARVAMTAILFFLQRDRVFTIVTCIVLLILVAGLIGIGS